MSRFYVQNITVYGSTMEVLASRIEFQDGVNIVHGPSNTGKSYILGCLNFMLGSSVIPFSKAVTKYDVIEITFRSTDGEKIRYKRMIVEGKGKKKEVASNSIEVIYSDVSAFPVGEYYADTAKKNAKPFSKLLLYLMGLTETPQIISTKDRDTSPFSLRTIFQFFYLDEDNIFKKEITFYPSHGFKKPVAIIMSLLYLFEKNNYAEDVPNESKKEREQKKQQKAGVVAYLNEKFEQYSDQRAELQKMKDEIGDENIEERLKNILNEIAEIENMISSTNEKCQQLLEQIFSITPLLDEMRLRRDRFHILHSQYDSDIKRLQFIADGESKRGKVYRVSKCPFCNHDMDLQPQQRIEYTAAINVELERVMTQVQDLELAESDADKEIQKLEKRLAELNEQYQQLNGLIEKQLKPKATKLATTKENYQNCLLLQSKIYAFDFITQEINDELTSRFSEKEEKVAEFDAIKKISPDLWEALNNTFQAIVRECGYPNNPVARIDIDSLDAVVNGKAKENEGKGYRAFLNTIMLFNLMKQLECRGEYAFHMLFLDSPILSLKEQENVEESELATPGMRESLFQYIISHCGENQIIIVENELPANVDYSAANLITFTKSENGRYGFLLNERDS